MRILIYGINFAPELTGIGKYSGEMAAWLAGQGHDVRVVTAPPYYPAWKVFAGYRGGRYARERIGGVAVLRCPLWVPARVGGLSRILHLASFALSSAPVVLWRGLAWRPDVVFVVEPAIFCAPAAWLAARLGGARAWLHVQDFEIDAAFDLGIVRSPVIRRIVLGLERWMMRRFDRVSTISDRMLDRLADKGVSPARRHLFPNWADTDAIRPLDDAAGPRRELGIPEDRFVLLYAGNMGNKQGLEILVELAELLGEAPDVLLVLCGDGAMRGTLEQRAAGRANIRFLPLQPIGKLNALMNVADIHLLPQRADVEDLVMPSKLTNMLASGRPVVATAGRGTAVARLVGRCGLVVGPGDARAMADAVLRLRGDPGLRRSLGEAGRRYAVGNLGRDVVLGRAFPASGAESGVE